MSGISTNATNQPVELRVGNLSLGRGLEIIQFKTISNETLNLDDKWFINCTIIDCTLEYSGGPVRFERTRLRGCKYIFFGKAKRTVHFLQGAGLMPFDPADWVDFSEAIN